MIKTVISLVVGLILGVAGATLYISIQAPQAAPQSGAIASPDITFATRFHDTATFGGTDFATSSQGAVTYTASMIANASVIEHNATAALTATLPTNSALSATGFLQNAGDRRTIFVHASTTLITIAGNTGVTLYSASSTKNIAAGSIGKIEFVRLGATEGRLIEAFLQAD